MLPLRLVIDTNVLVSAALKPEGLQRTTLILSTNRPRWNFIRSPTPGDGNVAEIVNRRNRENGIRLVANAV